MRQRRDYRVPSVAALLRVAEAARRDGGAEAPTSRTPVESVGEAVLELLQAGDGSLGALDIPELEPLDGVVMVPRWRTPLDPEAFDDDRRRPARSRSAADDRLVGRLDEHPYVDLDEDDDEAEPTRPSDAGARRRRRAGCVSTTGRAAAGLPTPAAQHHLPGAVAEQPHPGQLPAGVLGLDRQLRRGGHPVDIRRQPQRRVLVVHAIL